MNKLLKEMRRLFSDKREWVLIVLYANIAFASYLFFKFAFK